MPQERLGNAGGGNRQTHAAGNRLGNAGRGDRQTHMPKECLGNAGPEDRHVSKGRPPNTQKPCRWRARARTHFLSGVQLLNVRHATSRLRCRRGLPPARRGQPSFCFWPLRALWPGYSKELSSGKNGSHSHCTRRRCLCSTSKKRPIWGGPQHHFGAPCQSPGLQLSSWPR
jgi:hypothetical protein